MIEVTTSHQPVEPPPITSVTITLDVVSASVLRELGEWHISIPRLVAEKERKNKGGKGHPVHEEVYSLLAELRTALIEAGVPGRY